MKPKINCSFDEVVPLEDLKPHPWNPNVHPTEQIEKLAELIRFHGWRVPVTVSKKSGYIVRGHGRYMAAGLIGVETVPVDYQEYKTEDDELKDLVADNKIAELSMMDELLSQEVLNKLVGAKFDLGLAGFDIGKFKKSEETSRSGADGATQVVTLPYVFLKEERAELVQMLSGLEGYFGEEPDRVLLAVCNDYLERRVRDE